MCSNKILFFFFVSEKQWFILHVSRSRLQLLSNFLSLWFDNMDKIDDLTGKANEKYGLGYQNTLVSLREINKDVFGRGNKIDW